MALLPVRQFRVIENRVEAKETFTLVLEPADDEPMFAFEAGQFVMAHLPSDDGKTKAKAYSIATAPCESSERFELGIKREGEFTSNLKNLRAGDSVGVQGPYGRFVLKKDAAPLVLFAGGIGITPLRSMLREALFTGMTCDIRLFISDRDDVCMAYESELRELAKKYPNFHPIFLFTRNAPNDRPCEACRLTPEIVRREIPDLRGAQFYMCGPKPFMQCVKEILEGLGVDTKSRLKQELF
ncbi:hypothetical protein HY479_03650 [Candidatus Uhrbacteria bacterium]|nr:hypothetical protein [Candidatus Uhrbacteria bacterium]